MNNGCQMQKNVKKSRAECRTGLPTLNVFLHTPYSIPISRARQSFRFHGSWSGVWNWLFISEPHEPGYTCGVYSDLIGFYWYQMTNTFSATRLVIWNGLSLSAQTGNYNRTLLCNLSTLPPFKYVLSSVETSSLSHG